MDLYYYWRIFLRRSPWLIFFVVIGSIVGVALALVLPPVYRSQAVMMVESEQIPDDLASSTVQTVATEQIQIIEQRILSREVLLEMANRLDIYPDDSQIPAAGKVADLRNRIQIEVRGGGRRGAQQATIVTVSFRAPTGEMAAAVTNEVITLFLQENIEMRTTVSGQTLDFFTQEVDRLGQEMSRLSARMLTFQEANLESLPDSLDFRRSQQAGLQSRLLQLDRDSSSLKDRRARLVELFEDTGTVLGDNNTQQMTPEARQLADLNREYANSVAVLSLNNPRVAVLRARIEALEELVREQRAAAELASVTDTEAELRAPPTPFEIQLADIDGQLSSIERQRVELENQLADLAVTIQATPGNAISLEAMQRDYENLRAQYNQTVSNKARAETGDMIEALSKGQRISLVEQAIAPNGPDSPNRPLVAVAGFAGGLFLGLAMILLLELLNSTIRRPVEISNKLGITALATIPYIRTQREIRRRRLSISAAVLATCVAIGGGLWVIDAQVIPLEQAWGRIMTSAEAFRAG